MGNNQRRESYRSTRCSSIRSGGECDLHHSIAYAQTPSAASLYRTASGREVDDMAYTVLGM